MGKSGTNCCFSVIFMLSNLILPIFSFDPNLALPETLEDEWGCAVNEGYFWCGSSSRCLQGDDVCEDGLGEAVKCQVEYKGLLWDLTHLRKSSALDYSVKATELKDVAVNFNLCANAATPADTCLETQGTEGEVMNVPAPGYAWEVGGTECKRLGESIKTRDNFEIKILDEMAPLKGISISYTGGNTCPSHEHYSCEDGKCQHSLKVAIYCHNTNVAVPELEDIEIVQPCTYKLDMHSVHGCPIECPRDGEGNICSNRGMCKAKEDSGTGNYKVMCLCEDPYSGEWCQKLGGDSLGPLSVSKYTSIAVLPSFWEELSLSVGAWMIAAILLLVVWRFKIQIWRCWLRLFASKKDDRDTSGVFKDSFAQSQMKPFQQVAI